MLTKVMFASSVLLSLVPSLAWGVSKTPKDTIVVALESEPRAIDPRYSSDANSQYLSDLTNCALINFDKAGTAYGSLASGWQWKSSTLLTMTIKKNIKFSNGKLLTAQDVKATYDFFKNSATKNPSPLAGSFKTLADIKAVNDYSLEFTFSEPDASFVSNFMIGILPQALASQEMISDPKALIGCGPYVIEENSLNDIKLVQNPHYNLGDKPKTSKIIFKIVKDETTRFSKLQAGELDIVQNALSRDKITDLAKKNPNLHVTKEVRISTTYLGFNMKDKLTGNPAVRKAISLAIDRDSIIKYILNGMAKPARTLLTPADPYLNKDLPAPVIDLKQAAKILDEAGFKDPDGNGPKPRFEMSYKTTTDVTRINIAKAIASQLKKIGILIKVESLEWGKFAEDVSKGQVQMWSLSWIGFKDPDIYRFAFSTDSFPPNGANRGWYSNKDLDKLLQEAKVTNDLAQRKKLYAAVQKTVADDLPYVFLWHEEGFAVSNKDVKGFQLYADGRLSSLVNTIK